MNIPYRCGAFYQRDNRRPRPRQARSPKPGGVWDPAGRRLQYGPIAEEVVVGGPGMVAAGADGKPQIAMYPLLAPTILNEVQEQRRTTDAQA